MSIFTAMNNSASGLTAERLRMDVISGNIANASTTRTEEGGAYRRKVAIFQENLVQAQGNLNKKTSGVVATAIVEDETPLERVYNPSHPDADEEGYVEMPNVDILSENIDLMAAIRAYEANVNVMNATKSMYTKALEIGR